MASDGNLYGTIPYGGFTINGVAPLNNSGGAVFQVTLGGVITGIYNITAASSNNSGWGDGSHPWGAVMQASDGYLYGTRAAQARMPAVRFTRSPSMAPGSPSFTTSRRTMELLPPAAWCKAATVTSTG